MKPKDSEDAIKALIHTTLERSKALSERNSGSPTASDHFHNYEFLMSLLGRRQAIANQTLERLTRQIKWLTVLIFVLTVIATVKLFF